MNPSPTLVLTFVLMAVPHVLAQTVPTHEHADRLHRDPTSYMAALDDPARDAWQRPHEVVTALGLREGDAVADIGAGSGYFALRFARHVGSQGRVYAVDVSPDMVAEVSRRAKSAGLANTTASLATPDDPGLPAGSLDVVFVCDTWHHIQNRGDYARKVRQALEAGGRLVIVDFHKDSPVGPPASMKLTRDEVIAEVQAAGFALSKEHTFLPHQYFLEFVPRAQAPRFADQIEALQELDRTHPPAEGSILFIGSSIFRRWTTVVEQMAPLPAYNRAFGGSRSHEMLEQFDPLVTPRKPRFIVYYCGSNDVAGGVPAATVVANVKQFVARVRTQLPGTRVFFVSINKAPSRRASWPIAEQVNGEILAYSRTVDELTYIDVNPALFDTQGNPRTELYEGDLLHFKPSAYEEFTGIIKPVLTRAWETR